MTATHLPGQLELATVVDHSLQKYWLCCGSLDPMHSDKRGESCIEAKSGHPERCKFGTVEENKDVSPHSRAIDIAKLLRQYEDRPTSETWSRIQSLAAEILK